MLLDARDLETPHATLVISSSSTVEDLVQVFCSCGYFLRSGLERTFNTTNSAIPPSSSTGLLINFLVRSVIPLNSFCKTGLLAVTLCMSY